MGRFVLVCLLAFGCGGGSDEERPVPTCPRAFNEFALDGCDPLYLDAEQVYLDTDQAIGFCSEVDAARGDSCDSEYATWLYCIEGPDRGERSGDPCDCILETRAIRACAGI